MQSFYLQDSRSYTGDGLMFWALGGGYTTNIDQAERFTQDQAQGQHDCRETDVPWPAAYIEQRSHRGVDCQYVSQADAAPLLAQGGPVVLHVPKDWNGNDLIWIGAHGQRGPVLDRNAPGWRSASRHHGRHWLLSRQHQRPAHLVEPPAAQQGRPASQVRLIP